MTLHLALAPHDTLVVTLQDGPEETMVTVSPSRPGAESLRRALDGALRDGYGECFWPAPTGGQYWWIFKRHDETLETIAMWTRGGASLWEHVFRGSDSGPWVEERLTTELERLGLIPSE